MVGRRRGRAATAPSRHCSHPPSKRRGDGPTRSAPPSPPWSGRSRASSAPADASASGRTRRPCPTVSASTSSSRCWRAPASRTTRFCGWRRPKARWRSGSSANRHARGGQARRLRRPRRRPADAHRRYLAHRRRRQRRRLARAIVAADAALMSAAFTRRSPAARTSASQTAKFAQPCETAGYLSWLIYHASMVKLTALSRAFTGTRRFVRRCRLIAFSNSLFLMIFFLLACVLLYIGSSPPRDE